MICKNNSSFQSKNYILYKVQVRKSFAPFLLYV
nr:MAG TPA: hypothetical protein [Microviridae sp.]